MRHKKQVGYAVHTISSGGSLKRSLGMENTQWVLIPLISFLFFASNTSYSLADQPDATPTTQNQTTANEQTITPEQEQSRREFKAMLWASIIILTGFFSLVFMLFIFRMARAARRLQNAREEKTHTEVIDAWSNYRLPDDATQDFMD